MSSLYLTLNLSSHPLLAMKSPHWLSYIALFLTMRAVSSTSFRFEFKYHLYKCFSICGSFVFQPPPFLRICPTFIHRLRLLIGALKWQLAILRPWWRPWLWVTAMSIAYLFVSWSSILYLDLLLEFMCLTLIMRSGSEGLIEYYMLSLITFKLSVTGSISVFTSGLILSSSFTGSSNCLKLELMFWL